MEVRRSCEIYAKWCESSRMLWQLAQISLCEAIKPIDKEVVA